MLPISRKMSAAISQCIGRIVAQMHCEFLTCSQRYLILEIKSLSNVITFLGFKLGIGLQMRDFGYNPIF